MGLMHLPHCRFCRILCAALLPLVLAACGSLNLGVSIPVGPHTGVGVSVGTDGRVGVGVGVSAGGGTVSVGTSGQLPVKKPDDTEDKKQ